MTDRWSRGSLLAASPSVAWGCLIALLGVAVVTALIHPLREIVPAVSTGVLYLLPVLLVSIVWGRWLGIATSVLSAGRVQLVPHPADPPVHDLRRRGLGCPGDLLRGGDRDQRPG